MPDRYIFLCAKFPSLVAGSQILEASLVCVSQPSGRGYVASIGDPQFATGALTYPPNIPNVLATCIPDTCHGRRVGLIGRREVRYVTPSWIRMQWRRTGFHSTSLHHSMALLLSHSVTDKSLFPLQEKHRKDAETRCPYSTRVSAKIGSHDPIHSISSSQLLSCGEVVLKRDHQSQGKVNLRDFVSTCF
jgi:hypothetical protein